MPTTFSLLVVLGDILVLRYTRSYFGDSSIELAGRVIDPAYQRQGIGTALLERYIDEASPHQLVTYTRNASILRMLGRVSSQVYPLVSRPDLQARAEEVSPGAVTVDNATYQTQRYSEEGLFIGYDPADRSYDATGYSLKQRFMGLQSVRAALVVVADVRSGSRS